MGKEFRENEEELTVYPCLGDIRAAESEDDISPAEIDCCAGSRPDHGPNVREKWKRPIEFLLSCIAASVGLGNLWRFPFTAMENGGGAFLIPYLLVLFFIGKPLYFLELAVGQFSSRGQVKVWKMSPIFKGVGYASNLVNFTINTYYCSMLAVILYYLIVSMQGVLPWTECDPSWSNWNCTEEGQAFNSATNKSVPMTELYFRKTVLKAKDNIDDGIGLPGWKLTLCLLFSWVVVFGSICKGVKSSGKVAYATALIPYILLTILLVRAVTLDGAMDGILYFITPNWGRILEAKVWFAAISQCFFSLEVGFGVIVMFGSYNRFDHNVYRDAWIISLMDTFTSLIAGFTIFSILGNMVHVQKSVDPTATIENFATQAMEMAFVMYPRAIASFGLVPQVFAVLFFLMLFILGVGSANSSTLAVVTVIRDRFPHLHKTKLAFVICVIGFTCGLLYVTPGGDQMVELVDAYAGEIVLYTLATVEVIGISWVYGLSNVCRDIEFMLKRPGREHKIGIYWKICWGVVIPTTLLVVLGNALYNSKPLQYKDQDYPTVALVCGRLLTVVILGLIPAMALYVVATRPGQNIFQKLRNAIKPADDWGPQDKNDRREWQDLKELEPPRPWCDSNNTIVRRIINGNQHNLATM